MRWRGAPLDGLLAVSGTGLDLLLSGKAGDGPVLPASMTVPMALLAGAPLAFLRRWPLPVTLYLAAFLVFADQVGSFTANTAHILLNVAVGVVAHRCRPWALAVALPAAIAANAVNTVDPGVPFTSQAALFCVLVPALPVLVGAYLRGPAGRLDGDDLTPDVLLAGAGVAGAVLGTWTDWDSGSAPVPVVGLLAVSGGLSLGLARRLPGLVLLVQGMLLLAADTYLEEAVNNGLILTLIALGVFAQRVTSWAWTVVAYVGGFLLAGNAVVEPGVEVTPFRVAVLMALTVTPAAIGRYLAARQAAAAAERLRAEHEARLAVAQVRADQLAERERIAREVHDIVAHHVGAMVLRAGAARYAAPRGPVADALGDIRDTGHQVLEDLRGLLDVLRTPDNDGQAFSPDRTVTPPVGAAQAGVPADRRGRPDGPGGTAGAVAGAAADRRETAGVGEGTTPRRALASFRATGMLADPADVMRDAAERVAAAGLVVDLHLDPQAGRAPLVARASAARIIQEGLTNVLKHAGPGTEVRVALTAAGKDLTVDIRNGRPPGRVERIPSSGRGMTGMRERVGALGGTLTAGPVEDGGWHLTAYLPAPRGAVTAALARPLPGRGA